MPFRLILSRRAIAELGEVAEAPEGFHADGVALAREILRELKTLEEAPWSGIVLARQGDRDYRELTHGAYRIIWEVSDRDQTISVISVWPTSRGEFKF